MSHKKLVGTGLLYLKFTIYLAFYVFIKKDSTYFKGFCHLLKDFCKKIYEARKTTNEQGETIYLFVNSNTNDINAFNTVYGKFKLDKIY